MRRQCFNAASVAICAMTSPCSVGMAFGIPRTTTEPSVLISIRTDAATASQSITGHRHWRRCR